MSEPGVLPIPATEYRRARWRNGRGWTREILALPGDPDWNLRLSIAELDAVADFSPFPGLRREQLLLSGNGLRLHFDDGETRELLPPHQRAHFDGARPVTGIPVDGPVQVFNLMWRPPALAAALFHRPLVGTMLCFCDPRTAWAVHVLAGSARIGEGGNEVGLAQGDSAWLPASADGRRRHAIDGAGALLLVQVEWPEGGTPPAVEIAGGGQ
ncbi:HutD/Ves family protein [Pseudoxanthomonas suwonensis]|uniref:HutD/Ves family protein n=1 Tax=Pseudoxanthomonas suwonensis TaxID=314722 RepID=UPI001E30C38A|nr:HutD family protein [Pseudoxanthomonas suwonensis]